MNKTSPRKIPKDYSQYISLEDTYVRSRRPRFSQMEKARLKQLSELSGNLEAKRDL